MNISSKKILKLLTSSIFLIIFFNSCASNIVNNINPVPANHKYLNGSNDFNSLISSLVKKQEKNLAKYIKEDEAVIVSDFVNLDKLKNRSKLGFLLSEQLKDSLSNKGVFVKAVELGKDFEYGKKGFNLLTREQNEISQKFIDNKYAVVGTYSITTKSLIVFVKLIDLKTGNILSSSSERSLIDEEILELERVPSKGPSIVAPFVL